MAANNWNFFSLCATQLTVAADLQLSVNQRNGAFSKALLSFVNVASHETTKYYFPDLIFCEFL